MKKLIIVLLTVALCCCAFFTVYTEAEPTVSVGYTTGYLGEEADVTISISDNPGVAALYFTLTYDTSALTLNSVEDNELIDDFQYYDNNGTVTLSWEPAIENTFASGDLATLKFTVKSSAAEGASSITLAPISHGIIDKFGNDVDINLISGIVLITHKIADISSSALAIDNTDNYISAITAGTTVSEILAKLDSQEGISLKNGETVLGENDKVATGTKLILSDNETPVKEYTLIVTGDNSGDGKITIKDMLNLREETYSPTLSGVYYLASDLNGDKVVNEDDFDIIKSHLLHNTQIVGIAYAE